jgi:hypothetical protein
MGLVLLALTFYVFLACVRAQEHWEALLLTLPNNQTVYDYFVNYTAEPHLAGTGEDYNTAVYTYNKMQGIR